MSDMRAKMRVADVVVAKDPDTGNTTGEYLVFDAVCKSEGYDSTGLDDDNTYAKWSPSGSVRINVVNPALFGKFEVGQKYYIDFTLAEK